MQWAMLTDPDATMSLVRSAMTFTQVAMVPEIGGWYEQAISTLADPPPYLYGCAAMTAFSFDSAYARAAGLAQEGIARAGSPTDPETADCWLAFALADAIQGGDLDAAGARYADVARERASALRSEIADACVALAFGAVAWKRGDIVAAVPTLRPVFEHVTACDVRGNVKMDLFRILALALADDPTAMSDGRSFLVRALRSAQSDGYQWGISTGLWVAGIYLAASGQPEPAAVLLGHLDNAGIRPIDAPQQRQRADDAIRAQSRYTEWSSFGAELAQHDALDYAIRSLESTTDSA